MSEIPELTDGEKTVLKGVAIKLLQKAFADKKWAGLLRNGVAVICGGSAMNSNDVWTQVINWSLVVASAAWSWIEKHQAAKKVAVLTKQADIVGTIDKLTTTLAALPNAQPLPTVAEIKPPQPPTGFIRLQMALALAFGLGVAALCLSGCSTIKADAKAIDAQAKADLHGLATNVVYDAKVILDAAGNMVVTIAKAQSDPNVVAGEIKLAAALAK